MIHISIITITTIISLSISESQAYQTANLPTLASKALPFSFSAMVSISEGAMLKEDEAPRQFWGARTEAEAAEVAAESHQLDNSSEQASD